MNEARGDRRDHDLTFHTLVPLMLPGCLHVVGNVLSEGNQTRSVAGNDVEDRPNKADGLEGRFRVVVHKNDYPKRNAKTAETGILRTARISHS